MSDNRKPNLDRLAAERAQAILSSTRFSVRGRPLSGGDVDNVVTKALGVLQENGIYACALYLLSRTQEKEQKIADVVTDEVLNLLAGLGFPGWEKPTISDSRRKSETVLKHISDAVTKDLEPLLLAKETLEQMLIYARYGAQARKAEEGD
ncbi:MAG: hypothetical protein H8E35_08840 [Ardenticatenia bacterium]|nr:hypothetical protein [Ardenticatenia bacterium]